MEQEKVCEGFTDVRSELRTELKEKAKKVADREASRTRSAELLENHMIIHNHPLVVDDCEAEAEGKHTGTALINAE